MNQLAVQVATLEVKRQTSFVRYAKLWIKKTKNLTKAEYPTSTFLAKMAEYSGSRRPPVYVILFTEIHYVAFCCRCQLEPKGTSSVFPYKD